MKREVSQGRIMENPPPSTPKISVIVTTYKREDLLKETLDSILSQSFSDIEVIVVDNESNYDFQGLIQSFGDLRIRGLQHQNHGVISINRNVALKLCRGQAIAFCDDDDIWLKEKLKKQWLVLENNPKIQLVATNLESFPNGTPNLLRLKANRHLDYQDCLAAPLGRLRSSFIGYSSVLARKSAVESAGRFDPSEELVSVEDYDFWLRLLSQSGPGLVLKESLVRYRLHNSAIMQQGKVNKVDRLEAVYRRHLPSSRKVLNRLESKKAFFKAEENILSQVYRGQSSKGTIWGIEELSLVEKTLLQAKCLAHAFRSRGG
jgi:teichuronic acid biosynthesis glycosyltransferase TuaG